MSQDSLPYVNENEMPSHWYSLTQSWCEANRCRCYLVNTNFTLISPASLFSTVIVSNKAFIRYADSEIISAHPATMCQDLTQAPLEWWVIHADQMMLHYKEGWKHSSLMCHSNGVSAVHPSVFLTFCVSVCSLTSWSFWMGGGSWLKTSMVWRGLWLCSEA